jgi:hypothetical protein
MAWGATPGRARPRELSIAMFAHRAKFAVCAIAVNLLCWWRANSLSRQKLAMPEEAARQMREGSFPTRHLSLDKRESWAEFLDACADNSARTLGNP